MRRYYKSGPSISCHFSMNFGIRRTLACIGKELTIPASARNISSSTTHSMSSLKVRSHSLHAAAGNGLKLIN